MSSKLDPRQPGDDVTTTEPVEQEYRTFGEAMSPTIGELAGAMAKAQGAMTNGAKDKEGYGYMYMTLAGLIDIARKPLSDNGIAILQSHELIRTKVPTVVTHTTVMHSSGEWHKSSIELPIKIMPNLSLSQMVGIAASYGRRYSHQALVQVTGEEDTDGV